MSTQFAVGPCCGCGGGTVPCAPCDLPETDLTLSWSGSLIGSGSYTFTYTPGTPPTWVYDPAAYTIAFCAVADSLSLACDFGGSIMGLNLYQAGVLICTFSFSAPTYTCSPLSVSETTGPSFSNACTGCGIVLDSVTFTVTG
jgi:hypothetical protein